MSPEPGRQIVVGAATVSAGHASPAVPVQLSSGSQMSPEPGVADRRCRSHYVIPRTRHIRIDPYSSHPGHRCRPNPDDRSSLAQRPCQPDTRRRAVPVQLSSGSQMSPEPGVADRRCRSATTSPGHATSALTRTALIRVTDVARTRTADRGGRRPPYHRRTRVARRTPLQRLVRVTDIARTRVADRRRRRPLRHPDTTHPDRPCSDSSGSHRSPEPVRQIVVAEATVSVRTRVASRTPAAATRPGRRYRPEPALQIVVAESHYVGRTRHIRIARAATRPGHIGHPNPYGRSWWPPATVSVRTRVARRTPLQRLVRVTDIARTRVADRCRRRPLRRPDTTHPDRPCSDSSGSHRSPEPVRQIVVAAGNRIRPDTRRQPYTAAATRPGHRYRPNPRCRSSSPEATTSAGHDTSGSPVQRLVRVT